MWMMCLWSSAECGGTAGGCTEVDVEVLLLNVELLLDVDDVLVDPVPGVVALLEDVLVDVEVLLLSVECLLDVGDMLVE